MIATRGILTTGQKVDVLISVNNRCLHEDIDGKIVVCILQVTTGENFVVRVIGGGQTIFEKTFDLSGFNDVAPELARAGLRNCAVLWRVAEEAVYRAWPR